MSCSFVNKYEAAPPAIMEERLRFLFRQYFENSCTKKELEEFFFYIRQSRYEERLRQMIKKVYSELRDSESFSTFVDEHGRLVLTKPGYFISEEEELAPAKPRSYAGALATIAILIFAGTIWLVKNRGTIPKRTVSLTALTKKTTDRSEFKTLLLEDSTQVWLNAASSLEFPDQFDKQKREVYLSGEAFFDVRHAEKVPFVIHTGGVSITVLGTAFNVKAYPSGQVTVAVSRGKVKVTRPDGWETILEKGEQVKLETNRKTVTEKPISVSDVAAWQQGYLVFDDEPLADIIADMERIYNVSISLLPNTPGAMRISTSFRKEIGIAQALQVLCKLTDTQLKTLDDNKYQIQ